MDYPIFVYLLVLPDITPDRSCRGTPLVGVRHSQAGGIRLLRKGLRPVMPLILLKRSGG